MFVNREIALKLKLIKFYDSNCLGYYDDLGTNMLYPIDTDFHNYRCVSDKYILAPTYDQVHKWFREKHNIHIVLTPKQMYPDDMVGIEYYWMIYYNNLVLDDDGVYLYEEAYDKAIEKGIELIKSWKQRNL